MRAKKSFKARFDTELSFVEGDVITVMVDAEDMWSRSTWWCGMLRGRKGLFATENVESFNQENVRGQSHVCMHIYIHNVHEGAVSHCMYIQYVCEGTVTRVYVHTVRM